MIKTSKSKEAKTTFLPFVCPSHGVLEKPWASHWLRERESPGLSNTDVTFLLPLPGANGVWLEEAASSRFATKWLRCLLRDFGQTQEQVQDLTTHSLKGTPLAWSAKFGLSITVRQMLGHHVPSNQLSALTYSRDAQSYPVREYERVLRAIREGRFDPDGSRSGLFPKPKRSRPSEAPHSSGVDDGFNLSPISVPDEEPGVDGLLFEVSEGVGSPCAVEPPQEEEEDPNISDSEDSSSSSDSSVDDEAEIVLPRARCQKVTIPEGCKLFGCIKSGLLHACLTSSELKLACGKPISKSYRAKQAHESSKDLKCIPCFVKVSAMQDSA